MLPPHSPRRGKLNEGLYFLIWASKMKTVSDLQQNKDIQELLSYISPDIVSVDLFFNSL